MATGSVDLSAVDADKLSREEEIELLSVASPEELYRLIASDAAYYLPLVKGCTQAEIPHLSLLQGRTPGGTLTLKFKIYPEDRWTEIGFFDYLSDAEIYREFANHVGILLKRSVALRESDLRPHLESQIGAGNDITSKDYVGQRNTRAPQPEAHLVDTSSPVNGDKNFINQMQKNRLTTALANVNAAQAHETVSATRSRRQRASAEQTLSKKTRLPEHHANDDVPIFLVDFIEDLLNRMEPHLSAMECSPAMERWRTIALCLAPPEMRPALQRFDNGRSTLAPDAATVQRLMTLMKLDPMERQIMTRYHLELISLWNRFRVGKADREQMQN